MTQQTKTKMIKVPVDGTYDWDFRQVRQQDGVFQIKVSLSFIPPRDASIETYMETLKANTQGLSDMRTYLDDEYTMDMVVLEGWSAPAENQLEAIEAGWI